MGGNILPRYLYGSRVLIVPKSGQQSIMLILHKIYDISLQLLFFVIKFLDIILSNSLVEKNAAE